MSPADRARTLVVGLGNELRGDDAAGLLVARALRGRLSDGAVAIEHEGEPVALLDLWEGAAAVLLADAVAGGREPGAIHRFDAHAGPLPATFGGPSTHALGLTETVELARALGRLPRELTVFGIEGTDFATGATATPRVLEAVDRLSRRIETEVARQTTPGRNGRAAGPTGR